MDKESLDPGGGEGGGLGLPQHKGGGDEKAVVRGVGKGGTSPRGQNRRRKLDKRETKTYEIARGRFGFGFTLSGQHPSILSSVIPESPAEQAGLKSGDNLITVNSRNVTRLAHGEVVRLISQSQGLIRVQVCEVWGLDSSSEEEEEDARYRPGARRLARRDAPLRELDSNKYAKIGGDYDDLEKFVGARERKPVTLRRKDTDAEHFSDGEQTLYHAERRLSRQHIRSSSIDSSFIGDLSPRAQPLPEPSPKKGSQPSPNKPVQGAGKRPRPLPSPPTRRRIDLGVAEELSLGGNDRQAQAGDRDWRLRRSKPSTSSVGSDTGRSSSILQAVVGYLGTIELSLDSTAGLQDIRNCIRRLRVEKKVHTLVLFVIHKDKIVLINHHSTNLAEFMVDKISFCGVCEDDKRFFGLVTKQAGLGDSCSCHVFMVEPTSSQHERFQRARVFNIQPTYNEKGDCAEFPVDADPILNVIYSIKGVPNDDSRNQNVENPEAASLSSLSNSVDSGIVYRDDTNQAQNGERAIIRENGPQEEGEPLAEGEIQGAVGGGGDSKLGVRAMPDPAVATDGAVVATPDTSFNSDRLECLQSAEHIRLSMHKYLQDKHEHLKRSSQQLAERHLSSLSSQDSGLQNVQRLIKEKFEQRAVEVDRGGFRLPPARSKDRTAGTPTPSASERSYARSLEELPTTSSAAFNAEDAAFTAHDQSINSTGGTEEGDGIGPPSLPLMSSLPLARFLYSSDSNLSQVAGEDTVQARRTADSIADWVNLHSRQHNPLTQPRWQEGLYGGVLKPSDQYPVDPLVKLRPRSRISNKSHRSSMFEFSDYDNFSAPNSAASTLSRRLDSAPHSAASTLSRKRRQQQEPSIEEEEISDVDNFDRISIPGELDGLPAPGRRQDLASLASSQALPGGGRVRQRRKSDSESIRETTTTFSNEEKASSREKDIGRVGGWAADFDKLLADPAGIHTFAEFLKKEFSHENIYFWCFCQRYTKIKEPSDRLKVAREIFDLHMSESATEPVNVDAVARSITQDKLQECQEESCPGPDLFETAQKQIYNLMKFDSFSRFLKSDLYKDSLLADMGGTPLPINGQDPNDPQLAVNLVPIGGARGLNTSSDSTGGGKNGGKGGKEGGEGSRRRSILPWGRNRSKSKDRADQEKVSLFKGIRLPGQIGGGSGRLSSSHDKSPAAVTDQPPPATGGGLTGTESRVSLDSGQDVSGGDGDSNSLTRFILPDKATTVVPPTPGESIRATIAKLLDKRGLKFTSFDAFLLGSDKPLDLSEDAVSLVSAEVRVEPRVLFSVELPNRKCIGVKAKQNKKVEDVLRPILQQYGWNLDLMNVQIEKPGSTSRGGIDYNANVTSIDNCRLSISSNQDLQNNELDQFIKRNSDTESTKSESRPVSRNSSGNTNIVFRRQMSATDISSGGGFKRNSQDLMPPPVRIPSLRRMRSGQPVISSPSFREQESQLYEGLKRMTQGRLDDQRGTEINMELPDFLKQESSGPGSGTTSSAQDVRRGEESRNSTRANLFLSRLSGEGDMQGWDKDQAKRYLDYIDSTFTKDGGFLTNVQQADDVFITPDPDETMNFSESRISFGFRSGVDNTSQSSLGPIQHNSSQGHLHGSGPATLGGHLHGSGPATLGGHVTTSSSYLHSKSLEFGSMPEGLSLPARASLGFTINYESIPSRQSRGSVKDYEFLRNNPELDHRLSMDNRVSVDNLLDVGRRISVDNLEQDRRISMDNHSEVTRRISVDNSDAGRRISSDNPRMSMDNPRMNGSDKGVINNEQKSSSTGRKSQVDYEPVQFRQSLPSHTQPPPAPTLHRKSPIHQGGGGHHLPPHPSFQGGGVRPPPPLYKPVPQYPNQVSSRRLPPPPTTATSSGISHSQQHLPPSSSIQSINQQQLRNYHSQQQLHHKSADHITAILPPVPPTKPSPPVAGNATDAGDWFAAGGGNSRKARPPPPPLPPKPVRLMTPSAVHAASQQQQQSTNSGKSSDFVNSGGIPIVTSQNGGLHLSLPGEKGYSVSFV